MLPRHLKCTHCDFRITATNEVTAEMFSKHVKAHERFLAEEARRWFLLPESIRGGDPNPDEHPSPLDE